MYGIRMFGSNHEALRLLKLVPENGTDPSGANVELERRRSLAQLKYGPWIARRRLNRRGREVLFEVLYSSHVRHQVLRDHPERGAEHQAWFDLPGNAHAWLEIVQVLRCQRTCWDA